MTSNEYYGGLNDRFEQRSAILRKAGFKYQRVTVVPDRTGGQIAVFVRTNPGVVTVLSAGTVLNAEERAWTDQLRAAGILTADEAKSVQL